MAERDKAWIGVDIGKTHHWVCAVDENGQKLLSWKVLNDETQILEVITAVGKVAAAQRGQSTSSALLQRCWSRYWPRPAIRSATPPVELLQR